MKKNMGDTDKMIRIVIASIIGLLFWKGVIAGVLGFVLVAVALVFLFTSTVSFCPIYKVLGLSTCPVKQKK